MTKFFQTPCGDLRCLRTKMRAANLPRSAPTQVSLKADGPATGGARAYSETADATAFRRLFSLMSSWIGQRHESAIAAFLAGIGEKRTFFVMLGFTST